MFSGKEEIAEEEWEGMIEIANRRLNARFLNKKDLLEGILLRMGITQGSEFLGIYKSTFLRYLKEIANYEWDGSYNHWNLKLRKLGFNGNLDDYLRLNVGKVPTRILADRLHCTPQTLLKRAKELGIKTPQHGGFRRYTRCKEERYLKIPKRKLKKMNTIEIAKEIGCSDSYVSFLARKHLKSGRITGIDHAKYHPRKN